MTWRGRLGVEVAGRLVGPHDRGLADQRAGDRDPLLLAARQLGGPVVERGGRARPARASSRAAAARRLGLHAGEEQRQLDVLDAR